MFQKQNLHELFLLFFNFYEFHATFFYIDG